MDYKLKKKLWGKVHVHYACPSCGEALDSVLGDAGQDDECPACGQKFRVPGERESRAGRERTAPDIEKQERREEANMTIEQRIEWIEKQNRRLKWAMTAVCAVVAAVLLGVIVAIVLAVRELFPRSASWQMEEAVQAGMAQSGMGPIAKKLTLEEAETLAARVGDVVQTSVTVDPQAVQDLQRYRAKSAQSESFPVAGRVQFSRNGGDNWVPGIVVGHGPPSASRTGSGWSRGRRRE